jgi:hypothetical protein
MNYTYYCIFFNYLYNVIILVTLAVSTYVESKILIITHNYNQPHFIELQQRCFQKFLKDPYEYVVFNDANDETIAQQIVDTCGKLNIRCIRIPQTGRVTIPFPHIMSWASNRHAQAIQYSMDVLGYAHNDLVVLIDADMFLVEKFCILDFLQDYDIAGLRQASKNNQITYLWPALIFFRMNNLPNKSDMKFFPAIIEQQSVDTGGYLYYYLRANPQVKTMFFNQPGRILWYDNQLIFSPTCGSFMCFERAQCRRCAQKGIKACVHVSKILEELKFSEEIVKCSQKNEFPQGIEFILNGCFVHFRDVSNHANAQEEAYNRRLNKLYCFLAKVTA